MRSGMGGVFRRWSIGATIGLVAAVVAMLTMAANPHNVFSRRSSRFSMMTFQGLEVGSSIGDAVAKLGDPIVVRDITSPPVAGCEQCRSFYFLGDAPRWAVFHTEAWVVVDANGKILEKTVNREP